MTTEAKHSLILLIEENTLLKAQLELWKAQLKLWKSRALALEKQNLNSKQVDVKKDLSPYIVADGAMKKLVDEHMAHVRGCVKDSTSNGIKRATVIFKGAFYLDFQREHFEQFKRCLTAEYRAKFVFLSFAKDDDSRNPKYRPLIESDDLVYGVEITLLPPR
jgi:hypothetical protein